LLVRDNKKGGDPYFLANLKYLFQKLEKYYTLPALQSTTTTIETMIIRASPRALVFWLS